jgi:hypothetical protein
MAARQDIVRKLPALSQVWCRNLAVQIVAWCYTGCTASRIRL